MHRTKILRALILGAVFVALTSEVAFAKNGADISTDKTAKKNVGSKLDVFKEFENKISSLEKSLAKEKDVTKRYDLFLKTFTDISELRKNNPRQAEDKEINMSLFMDALAPLPGKKEFQAKKCPEYLKEVGNVTKTYDEAQKDIYSDRALAITKQICK
jgi:hypothetical protein